MNMRLDKRNAFLSDGALDDFSPPALPANFLALAETSLAAGWTPGAEPVNNFFKYLGLPLNFPAERLLFTVTLDDDGFSDVEERYIITLRTEMGAGETGERQARALARLYDTARALLLLSGAGNASGNAARIFATLLLANSAEVEGNSIVITSGSMDRETLTLMLASFMAMRG
jgi:hypothetical protein